MPGIVLCPGPCQCRDKQDGRTGQTQREISHRVKDLGGVTSEALYYMDRKARERQEFLSPSRTSVGMVETGSSNLKTWLPQKGNKTKQ